MTTISGCSMALVSSMIVATYCGFLKPKESNPPIIGRNASSGRRSLLAKCPSAPKTSAGPMPLLLSSVSLKPLAKRYSQPCLKASALFSRTPFLSLPANQLPLNNCTNPAISPQIDSEFDYPRLASYYSSHAAAILSHVANTMTVEYGGDFAGTYDFATKSFPIVDGAG